MTAATAPDAARERAPSVLVVLVVRDAAEWLRECLQGLAAQTYARLGVLAVDDASSDGSSEILTHALGEARVLRHDERIGLARSFDEVLAHPAVRAADFLLLLHDDVALDPEAIARLVDATTLAGVERVGIVGGKVVEWDEPRRLRDVGRSADRFGHPYTPLQADEIDQGQFDRVLDVLSVDSCAMLVAKGVWADVGLFDERLGDDDGDLDLCWRARVAGWRVLMTPLARSRHRAAAELDERPGAERSRRFGEDRAALAAVLKNYSIWTLLWVVPLGLALSVVRAAYLILSRRFEEAYDLVAAIGWNVVHLPGTLGRRRRVQRRRRTRDHQLRRFMESAGLRIPRWFQTAERILEEQRELEEDEVGEPAARRLRHRTASLFAAHPVIVMSFVAAIVAGFAMRHLLGPPALAGGSLPAFPATPGGFFDELASGVRSTGLGGPLAASPALGAMGGLSLLLFGSTSLAQKVLVAGLPMLAGILAYRAGVRVTHAPSASVLGAAAYVLSAVSLWAFSEGRIGTLAALAVAPAFLERFEVAFTAAQPPDGRWRFVAGLAVTLAVGVAFEPGLVLAVGLVLLVLVAMAPRRLDGLGRAGLAGIGAAVLSFAFVPTIVAGGGAALGSQIGALSPWDTVRLAMGPGPGTWVIAAFLPIAAALGLALASGERRGPARRAGVLAVAALALCWLSAAGYLPAPLANGPVYAVVAAAAEALLVAFGLASVLGGIGRESFGFRQVGTALISAVLGVGLLLQAVAAASGVWAIGGPETIPPAWAVVDSAATGRFRVLWVGPDDGRPFPAPGGDPVDVTQAGPATLAWALTDREGIQAIDQGRPLAGPGADDLARSLQEILGGTTTNGGALLSPFSIRYVVGREDALPPAATARLDAQGDLDLIPASGLVIWRNAVALPPASVLAPDKEARRIIASSSLDARQRFLPADPRALEPTADGWEGDTGGGTLAIVTDEFDDAWTIDPPAAPRRAFGWAMSMDASGDHATIAFQGDLPRAISTWILAALWLAALWITRKPVRR
jgi:GT2 family glycosyltransferase